MRTRIHRAEYESAASLHAKVNTPRLRTSQSVLDTIGRTPLIPLHRLGEGVPAQVLVKLESLNPGGSIKDRVGVAMVEEAERRGWLQPGGTIIEATAGNTGVGLALAAAVKGYRCIFVLPDKMSGEKIRLLQGLRRRDRDHADVGAARLARELQRRGRPPRPRDPGAWRPNQFANLANPEVHYRTTGPEIWEQTGGRITAFVAGVGTGGTISGVGRYLKERNPAIQIIGADPEGSVLSGDAPRPWKVEGIGEDFVPKTLNGQVVDEWIRIGDAESFHTARALARREGMLVGGSAGTAVAAAFRYARRLSADDVVVALCPDTGRNYLSKFYDDAWLAENQLASRASRPPQTVGDLLRARGPRTLVTVEPGDNGRRGRRTVASQRDLAVARLARRPRGGQHPGGDAGPLAARRSSTRRACASATSWPARCRSSTSASTSTRPIACSWPATRACWRSTAMTVVDIITRIDLIQYWNRQRDRAPIGSARYEESTTAWPHDATSTASRPARSTPARTPTRPPGATVVPIYATSTFTQEAPASTRATSTPGAATRPGPRSRRAWPRSKGSERAWRSPRAWRRRRPCFRPCGRATRWPPRPIFTAAPSACSNASSSRGDSSLATPKTPAPRASPRSSTRPPSSSGSRRRPTRSSRSSTSRRSPSSRIAEVPCWRWTTRSRRPILQRPIELGADLVVHSTTKYLGGHSDVIGGAVDRPSRLCSSRSRSTRTPPGLCPDRSIPGWSCAGSRPWRCGWSAIAPMPGRSPSWLAEHPQVDRVYYPGLADHPNHDVARRQMRDFGGMISVRLNGGGAGGAAASDPHATLQPGREPGGRRVTDRSSRDDDAREHPGRRPGRAASMTAWSASAWGSRMSTTCGPTWSRPLPEFRAINTGPSSRSRHRHASIATDKRRLADRPRRVPSRSYM